MFRMDLMLSLGFAWPGISSHQAAYMLHAYHARHDHAYHALGG